jgi:hypothetical protein
MHLAMAGVTAPSHVYPSLALIAERCLAGIASATSSAATGAKVVAYPSLLPDHDGQWPDDAGEALQAPT